MKCIDELSSSELRGKRVLLRTDFNLPLDKNGDVSDTFRVEQSWKTVQYLSEQGARVIILSHIGRDPEDSIEPVAKALKKFGPIVFVPDLVGHAARGAASAMKDGEIVLLENVRRDSREVENDESFAKELASLAELYVNDAFAAAHRSHASIVGVSKFLPTYAGLLLRDEVQELKAARSPKSPSFAMLGGAKFETKAPLIQLLLEKYDHVLIVGALANDVFKAQGFPVGVSLVSKELPGQHVLSHPHFLAPLDVTVETKDGHASVKLPKDVLEEERIVDIGPDSVALIAPFIAEAENILWAGPTGLYEAGFLTYTRNIAELLAEAAGRGASVVIGGGDTIAAIKTAGVSEEKLGFLSTGGGAMLEYLLKGTLPGIEVLQ